MKVFGKKTLALVLTIAMALSLCSFTAFAADKTLLVGEKVTLTANYSGEKTIDWKSNDEKVATVKNGVVTGVKRGAATITATVPGDPVEGSGETPQPVKVGEWIVEVKIDTTKPITKVTMQRTTLNVPFGTSLSEVKSLLKDIILTGTYGDQGEQNVTASDWKYDKYDANTLGDYSFKPVVAGVADNADIGTVTVKVQKGSIGVAFSPDVIEVPVGTTKAQVENKLPKSAKISVGIGSAHFRNETWKIGTELAAWTSNYSETSLNAGEYVFQTDLSEILKDKYIYTNESLQVKVKTKSTCTLDPISVTAVIDGDRDEITTDLDKKVYSAITNILGKNPGSFEFTFRDLDLGSADKKDGYFTVDLTPSEEEDLFETGYLTDTFSYSVTVGGVTYTGSVTLTMYSTNVREDFKKESGTMSKVAAAISDRLKAYCGYGLDEIVFDNLDLEGGDLFTDSDCTEEVYEDEKYTASQLAKMCYVPNGSGEVSEIEYTAYASSSRYISGTIYLSSDEFLVIQVEMNTGDTLQFSAEEFEEAFLNLKKSYESLKSVTFNSGVPNSKSAGYVYYDGETKIKSGTFFVEPSKTSEKAIDDLTYEAGTEGGVYSIDFTAKGTDDRNKSVTVTGVYQITVRKAADLTIEAGVKESVSFDLDMFEEFYQENISKNYKNYDIVAVSFSGVPNSKEKGYLRNDGKSIKSPNDKKFYIDSDKEGDYAFEDLTFEGGSKASTTRAEFTVYAKKDGKGTAKTVTGTIDFIVGSTHSLSGSIKASETMKFAASLSAFEDLGGNDNVYVTFTGLPNGGKLVYNWGTGSQEDVKVGTEYYLSYKAGKKLLSNVTFVPSYSSSKQARTISIPVKAYNSKEKAVTGTINITVNYAAYSSKFTDITTSTYADSVDFLYNQGITTGMTATTFGPNSNVTRAQFVTFLYRAAGQPAVTGVTNKFTDVKSTGTYAYAYNAILWAVQNNITTGRSATKFDPAANVTHQELLTFLYRYDVNYLGHPGTQGSLSGFSDASSLQSYAVAPAKWAAYKGIIDGYTLQPAVAGSRATVALWLHRMLTL